MRRTEGREAVRMAMFLNILNRWESAELNQEEAAERPCPPPRPGTPNRSPRRVIERDNEVKGWLALEPGVPRAVLMQHRLRLRALLRGALGAGPAHCRCSFQPCVAPAEAMVPHQMLVEMLDREALIPLAIKPLQLPPPGRWGPAGPTPCRAGGRRGRPRRLPRSGLVNSASSAETSVRSPRATRPSGR
jgi:hypothetical protein